MSVPAPILTPLPTVAVVWVLDPAVAVLAPAAMIPPKVLSADASWSDRPSARTATASMTERFVPPAIELLTVPALLAVLVVASTPISDERLKHLVVLTQIQSLYLVDTPITDAAVSSLTQMEGLKMLGVSQTFITDDGVGALLKVVPGVIVPTRAIRKGSPLTKSKDVAPRPAP